MKALVTHPSFPPCVQPSSRVVVARILVPGGGVAGEISGSRRTVGVTGYGSGLSDRTLG